MSFGLWQNFFGTAFFLDFFKIMLDKHYLLYIM